MLKRLLVLIVCFSLLPAIFAFTNVKKKKPVQKIIIDPGHGGKDQGAKGLISTEAQLCLEMGLKLGKSIEQNFPNIKVLYTRTTDVLAG
ncbi:MAG: N-acetylmuramoyl-L-alanine amidase, partial [Chitinophagaceae bacterium]